MTASRQAHPKVYVNDHGTVWRLTEAAWLRMLRRIASGRVLVMSRLGRRLGSIESVELSRVQARDRLREELRRIEREPTRRPLMQSTPGELRWQRLSPGVYRALAADGREFEIYKTSTRGEPTTWSVRVNGEDVDTAAGKVAAQTAASKRERRRP